MPAFPSSLDLKAPERSEVWKERLALISGRAEKLKKLETIGMPMVSNFLCDQGSFPASRPQTLQRNGVQWPNCGREAGKEP